MAPRWYVSTTSGNPPSFFRSKAVYRDFWPKPSSNRDGGSRVSVHGNPGSATKRTRRLAAGGWRRGL